jgi:hypothetical protein
VEAVTLLTDVERDVFFPAFSRLSCLPAPAGAAPSTASRDFAGPYDSVEFEIEGNVDVGRLTWTPIDRECRLVLKAVRISEGSGASVPYRMSGNHAVSDGPALVFATRPPLLHFDLPAGARPRRFAAEFDLEQIGAEARGMAAAAAAPASLRQALRARLEKHPWLVRAYRSWIAPLRRRKSG